MAKCVPRPKPQRVQEMALVLLGTAQVAQRSEATERSGERRTVQVSRSEQLRDMLTLDARGVVNEVHFQARTAARICVRAEGEHLGGRER